MSDDLINRIVEAKEGDKEFILWRTEPKQWLAAIGNRSRCVPIGEAIAYGDAEADFMGNYIDDSRERP